FYTYRRLQWRARRPRTKAGRGGSNQRWQRAHEIHGTYQDRHHRRGSAGGFTLFGHGPGHGAATWALRGSWRRPLRGAFRRAWGPALRGTLGRSSLGGRSLGRGGLGGGGGGRGGGGGGGGPRYAGPPHWVGMHPDWGGPRPGYWVRPWGPHWVPHYWGG